MDFAELSLGSLFYLFVSLGDLIRLMAFNTIHMIDFQHRLRPELQIKI